MTTLRNDGAFYRADGLGDELAAGWSPGVVREVTAVQAAYLLTNQPRFSVVSVVGAARKPAVQKLPNMTNARQVVQDVNLGKYDGMLSAIAAAENERSKPRRSILKACKGRQEFIGG